MCTAYKTTYFCTQIHVRTSCLVPYDAMHLCTDSCDISFVVYFVREMICMYRRQIRGSFCILGLHTKNDCIQIFLVHRCPRKTAWYSLLTLQPRQSVKLYASSASQNETSDLSFQYYLFDHVVDIISKGELSITFLEWNRCCWEPSKMSGCFSHRFYFIPERLLKVLL